MGRGIIYCACLLRQQLVVVEQAEEESGPYSKETIHSQTQRQG